MWHSATDNCTEIIISVQQDKRWLMSVIQLTCWLKGFTVCVCVTVMCYPPIFLSIIHQFYKKRRKIFCLRNVSLCSFTLR